MNSYIAAPVLLFSAVVMTPGLNSEPISLTRLLLVSTIGGLALAHILQDAISARFKMKVFGDKLILKIIIISILISSVIPLVTANTSLAGQLFGVSARNNGLIANLSVVFIWAALANGFGISKSKWLSINFAVYFGGIFNVVYGLIQLLGQDPVKWNNPYGNPSIGTFGNPNNFSAFLAFFGCFLIARILFIKSRRFEYLVIDLVLICLVLFHLAKNGSSQGIISLIIGFLFIVIARTRNRFEVYPKFVKFCLILLSLFSALIFLLFRFYRDFAEKLFSTGTLETRFMFWKAAKNLLLDRPFTGVGWDEFGDWYVYYRDDHTAQNFASILTNSAHNLLIDYAVFGGLPLVISFLALIIYTTFKGLHFSVFNRELPFNFVAAYSIWLAFVAVSMVSFFNIAIVTWGFAFGGIALNTITTSSQGKAVKERAKNRFLGISFMVFCAAITFPAIKNDIDFERALTTGNGQKLVEISKSWPKNEYVLYRISEVLFNNSYYSRGREVALDLLEYNPQSIPALRLLLSDPELAPDLREKYLQMVRELDPRYIGP